MALSKKKPFRFSASDDIKLLREVVALFPYENSARWVEVAANVGLGIDARRCHMKTIR